MTNVVSPVPYPPSTIPLRALQRQLAALVPGAVGPGAAGEGPSLETFSSAVDLPRLMGAASIEGRSLRAVPVPSGPHFAFSAFLDGTQESRVLDYANALPIIHGRVAAVIRERRNRRLTTWRHDVVSRVYAPRALLSRDYNKALSALSVEVIDTTASADVDTKLGEHPFAIRDAAIHKVQEDRERAEHALAERWCNLVSEPLFIDGGISANDRVAREGCVVGVVKNHRTLYAEGEQLQVVLGLRAGERTSAFRITSPKRTTVASWYLRLRDPLGHDPMWGLVRVEIAEPAVAAPAEIRERADEVSRSILAEVVPLAMPHSRWDKMVYGIRDCEEFLRAVM
jgi:hypothetical protein